MNKLIPIVLLLISALNLSIKAQIPNTHDCMGAIPLCDTIFHQTSTISNVGNIPNEINIVGNFCLISELGGVWYRFVPTTSGILRFSIIPDNPAGEDFDWALFDLTTATCDSLALGNPYNYSISANTAGASSFTPPLANQGPTGINSDSAIVNSLDCLGPGAGDSTGIAPGDWNTFNPDVTVITGNIYYLYVAQFSGSQGYTLDFSESLASIINNLDASIIPPDTLCNLSSPITLTAADTGGIWSGFGITDSINGVFSPQTSGIGDFDIIYEIKGNCPISDTLEVKVITDPAPLFNQQIEQSFCNGSNLLLVNNSINSTTYQWYNNGSFLGSSEDLQVFDLQEGTHFFLLEASNNICKDSLEQEIIIPPTPQDILVPNVFTPNGDGSNDFFVLPNNIMECITELTVYNKWGLEVYNSVGISGWNGKNAKGKLMSKGTYFYIIKVKEREFKGFVVLM